MPPLSSLLESAPQPRTKDNISTIYVKITSEKTHVNAS